MKTKSNLNKFMTLLENDVYRSLKFVIPIIVAFFIAHMYNSLSIISKFNEEIRPALQYHSVNELVENGQVFGFSEIFQKDTLTIMSLSVLVIVLYTLLLWNKEWIGKSKSIYTLLSLPVKRSYILLSKTCTVFIFIIFNVVIQISTLFLDKFIITLWVDKRLIVDESVMGVYSASYRNLFNLTSMNIVVSLVLIIASILLLSLIVLLFRSSGVKGFSFGLILLMVHSVSPFIITVIHRTYFKYLQVESLTLCLIFSLIVSFLVYRYCKYLLDQKIAL